MKAFSRQLLWIVIVFFFLGNGCQQQRADNKDFFRYNQSEGIETLDPAFARSLSIMWGVHFIFNTLVEVDSSMQIRPSLAKSWSVSNDGMTFTFHLRTDVYFQDNPAFPDGKGRKMTAKDVVYSFERLVDPKVASAGAWVFHDRVADANPFVAANDSTFVLNLKRPFQPMLGILSMPYCSIVPHEVTEKWGKDFRSHPCGTGPFRLGFWDEGNVLMLYRNPHYWEKDAAGKQLPYLKGIKITFNETRSLEFLRFEQGELDFMNGIDGSMQDLVLTKRGHLRPKFQKDINLKKSVYLNTEYLGFLLDTSGAAFRNNPLRLLKVRQAINYAIDRRKIITYFRNGIGLPAVGGFIPPGMPGFKTNRIKGYEYNPQKALELLKEAGFPHGRGLPPIDLSTPDANIDVCTFIATELNDLGIPAKVQVMQNGLLHQQMSNSQLPFFKAQWIADYPDAETFLAFFYGALPAPPNYTRFKNTTYDNWYRQSVATKQDGQRFSLYRKMDSLAMSQAPVVPLYYGQILHFTHKNVHGLSTNALNIIDLKRVWKN